MKKRLVLELYNGLYYANYYNIDGEPDKDIIDIMGTNKVATPYFYGCDEQAMVMYIQSKHPSYIVELEESYTDAIR